MKLQDALRHLISMVENNGSHRTDCPACGGKGTFILTKRHGEVLWNCYRSSCSFSGKKHAERSHKDIRDQLSTHQQKGPSEFSIPEHWVRVTSCEDAVSYLRKNNSMVAYSNRLCDVRYDPRDHRVVFLITEEGKVVGAVGRALSKNVVPKWYRYDRNIYPFVAGTSDTAVLVEDAASACAVAPVATGIALLGTQLPTEYLSVIKSYKQVILALDPDAFKKALAMQSTIRYFTECRVVKIPDDLKYYDTSTIRTILNL